MSTEDLEQELEDHKLMLRRYQWLVSKMGEIAESMERVQGMSFGEIDQAIENERARLGGDSPL